MIITSVGVVLVLFAIFIVGKVEAMTESESLVNEIVAEVDALYEDETKAVLAEGVTMDMVVAIEEDIADAEEMTMTDEVAEALEVATTDLSYAKQMVELRDMALALLDDSGVLVDGADVQAVQEKADSLASIKPDWVGLMQMQIDKAKKQQDAITTATQNVNALFTDETRSTVRSDVTRSEYNTAQDSVDVVKNKTSKRCVQQSLNTVDSFPTEQEEKAEAEAEKAEQEQSAKSENTSSSSSSSNSSNDNDNNPNNSSSSDSNSGSSGSYSGDGSWSGEVEFEVDYYQVHSAMDQDGTDITDEVNHIKFETEEEMNEYMYSNYPGCSFSYTIAYKEIW